MEEFLDLRLGWRQLIGLVEGQAHPTPHSTAVADATHGACTAARDGPLP